MPEINEKELTATAKPLWLKALTAVQISNHSYAISLLQGILGENPGFLEARKLLSVGLSKGITSILKPAGVNFS